MKAQMWFDGACSGNPGPMGAGAVLHIGTKRESHSKPMGRGTNNEAEYYGVILGLRHALAAGVTEIDIHGDSQLVLRQLEGRYKVKALNLQPLYHEAKSLLQQFEATRFHWVQRDLNAAADEAARRAIGM